MPGKGNNGNNGNDDDDDEGSGIPKPPMPSNTTHLSGINTSLVDNKELPAPRVLLRDYLAPYLENLNANPADPFTVFCDQASLGISNVGAFSPAIEVTAEGAVTYSVPAGFYAIAVYAYKTLEKGQKTLTLGCKVTLPHQGPNVDLYPNMEPGKIDTIQLSGVSVYYSTTTASGWEVYACLLQHLPGLKIVFKDEATDKTPQAQATWTYVNVGGVYQAWRS
jgi:hypothetical protein